MKAASDPVKLRTVDLFCGCGGITLGFELHRGQIEFETVLGSDIDAAALRVFNQNVPHGKRIPTGRLTDLSWFSHRAEVLLYFLAHYCVWADDVELKSELAAIGFTKFLAEMRSLDEGFARDAEDIASTAAYQEAWSAVDGAATSLALYRGVLTKLGLRSLRTATLALDELPWTEEYGLFEVPASAGRSSAHAALRESAEALWEEQKDRFTDSAAKKGRGLNQSVGSRMATLARFFETKAMLLLREKWIAWRASRDSLRASFCLRVEAELDELYADGRSVQLILGGPPCKGWSRIGRAVIESLREQGVHAWASKQYGDERNALLHKYVLFLDALRPTAFLFENVAHFESSLRTPDGSVNAAAVLEEAITALTSRDLDFHVASRIVRARQHGIPQDRERYIMVGFRGNGRSVGWLDEFFDRLPRFDEEVPLKVALTGLDAPGVFDPASRASLNTDHKVKSYTLIDSEMPAPVREYLAWIRQPSPSAKQAPKTVDGHIVRRARDDDNGLIRYLAPGTRWMDYKFDGMPTLDELRRAVRAFAEFQKVHGESALPKARDLSALLDKLDGALVLRLLLEAIDPPGSPTGGHHLLHEGYLAKGTDRHGDWLERLSPDRPCKTIVAHIGKDTYGYIHPFEPRALSLREAARIQGFPDFFALGGSGVVDTYSMIGNAVPPLLANQFAASFEALQKRHAVFGGVPSVAPEPVERVPATKVKRERGINGALGVGFSR